jgi:glycosyltransferase involved in cell wall biosynthesis
MDERLTIAFISAFHAPFMQDDLETLEAHHTVRRLIGHGARKIRDIIFFIPTAHLIFCWFGSVYAFAGVLVGKMTGKRSIIVLGGVDIANDAALGYGIWLSWWRAKLIRFALRHANRVIAGDVWMKARASELAAYDGGNIEIIPPGFDSEVWKPSGEKQPMVLTVAALNSAKRVSVKGIDQLMAAARILPNIRFVVIGVEESVKQILDAPDNVQLLGLMERKELLSHYRSAKVYCQPSRHEAVGYSLREAMLCGCIPVVADVEGMPSAAAGIGILVPPGDVESLVVGIQKAMNMDAGTASRARARIVALFPLATRRSAILRMVGELAG